MKKMRRNPKHLINGSIALFLVILLLPFLTIALVLVEAGRYNSSVTVLDEAISVSSVSVLANYDEYLQDRWGLLAIDQEEDIDSLFSLYLTENSGTLGTSIEIKKADATGYYALSDSEVIYSQILEYCALSAPTTLASNFSNISEIIKKLEKIKSLGNIFSVIGSTAGALDAGIDLGENAAELKNSADALDALKEEYEEKYEAFIDAYNALVDAASEERPDEEEDPEGAEDYDDEITELGIAAENAADDYAAVIEKIIDELENYLDEMSGCTEAIKSIQSEISSIASDSAAILKDLSESQKNYDATKEAMEKLEKEEKTDTDEYNELAEKLNEYESEISEMTTEYEALSAGKSGLNAAMESWEQSFSSYSDENLELLIEAYEGLLDKLYVFDSETCAAASGIIAEDYYYISLEGYIDAEDIDAYLAEQSAELSEGSFASVVKGFATFINSILKTSVFYDASLSAYIDVDYYTQLLGGLPGDDSSEGGVLSIISDIGDIFVAIASFASDLVTLQWIDALYEIKNLINSISSLLEDIAQFAVDICNNIIDLFTTGYDRLYYSTYTTFNLSCRTDAKNSSSWSYTTMTGAKIGSETLPSQSTSTNYTVFGTLSALVDSIKNAWEGTGDDYTFSGAELEYILFGSNSEIANQTYVFVALYLFRLLMDVSSITTSEEVTAIASMSTYGYSIIMFLYILAEPLAETILLVNGAEINLTNCPIYLAPSNIGTFINQLVTLCNLTTKEAEEVGSDLQKALGAGTEEIKADEAAEQNELLNFNYREYCFFLLLLTVTEEQQMARLQNLIQMEGTYYYNELDVSYTFDLSKSYTFIETDVEADISQMLPTLTSSSLFTVSRVLYRGY